MSHLSHKYYVFFHNLKKNKKIEANSELVRRLNLTNSNTVVSSEIALGPFSRTHEKFFRNKFFLIFKVAPISKLYS